MLGASIVGKHAGELILPWVLAVQYRIGVSKLAQAIVPYPTMSEASARAAGSFHAPNAVRPADAPPGPHARPFGVGAGRAPAL